MPRPLNHLKCRAMLCLVCVKKKSVRSISPGIQVLIETHYKAGLDPKKDERLPTKICEKCRQHLTEMSNGRRSDRLEVFDYEILNSPPARRNGMYFDCQIPSIIVM